MLTFIRVHVAEPSRHVRDLSNGRPLESTRSEAEVVYREDGGSMLSFDLVSVSGQGQDLAVVTDQECLVYLQQPV